MFKNNYCRFSNSASGLFDKSIKIWNIETSSCIRTLTGHSGYVLKLELSEMDELITCSSDHTIKLWDIENRDCVKNLVGHSKAVSSIGMGRSDHLISCSVDGTIKVWYF